MNESPLTLSVIIVNYNVRVFLENALGSVGRALRNMNGEVIVVDNASDDGSIEMVRRKYPEVQVIGNDRNIGFAAANNLALARARGEYIFLLNPDTVVQEDTFQSICDFLTAHPDAGMAGCKILNPDGTLQAACRRSFPTPWVAFTKVSGLSALFPRSRLFGRYNLGYLSPEEMHEVDAVSGSFMAVRRAAIDDAGPLDEQFFMYGEDLDWCYRIKQAGWKVYYVPSTRIIHFKGESVRRSDIDEVRYFYMAMRIFVRKHHRRDALTDLLLRGGITVREWLAFLVKISRPLRASMLDLVIMICTWLAAEYFWLGAIFRFPPYAYPAVLLLPWALVATTMYATGSYTTRKHSITRVAGSVVIGYTLIAALTFFFKEYGFSRMVVIISGLLNIVLLCGWRMAARAVTKSAEYGRRSIFGRPALIVGSDEPGRDVVRKLRQTANGSYDVVGFIDTTNRKIGEKVEGVEILGSIDNIGKIIQEEKISEVIFSTDVLSYKDILSVIARSRNRSVNFRLVPNSREVIIGKTHIDQLTDLPFVEIEYKIQELSHRFFKRALDVCGSLILSVTILPLVRITKSPRVSASVIGTGIGNLQKVLRGEMSLVGPTGEVAPGSPPNYLGKRGLVSLADLNLRGEFTAEEREKYDVYYAKNQSLLLDLEILMNSFQRTR